VPTVPTVPPVPTVPTVPPVPTVPTVPLCQLCTHCQDRFKGAIDRVVVWTAMAYEKDAVARCQVGGCAQVVQ